MLAGVLAIGALAIAALIGGSTNDLRPRRAPEMLS
jgi:hypothetical protein